MKEHVFTRFHIHINDQRRMNVHDEYEILRNPEPE